MNQIMGFQKYVCREPKPTKKGGQQMREISRGKWRHVREGGGVAYIMAGDVCIATMNGAGAYNGKDNETREREAFGNGEIMAASGALLVACRAMRQFLIERHGYNEGPTGRRPLCLIEADGAISLAVERLEWPKIERVQVKDMSFDVRDDPSLPPLSREA